MKHHFLLLRHCVRSTVDEVSLGIPGYPYNLEHYVRNPLPNWNVPEKWCTENSLDLVENNGAWFVDSGIISSDTHVEIISDDAYRDVDTALSLSLGILDELDYDVPNESGMDLIRTKTFMFHPEEEICTYVEEGIEQQVQDRFENIRLPDYSFHHALGQIEEIMGTGRVGSLVDFLPADMTLDYEDFQITGAAQLLKTLGETLFYAKAGLDGDAFVPGVTVEQVYKLLQFHDWYRSVLDLDNNWEAMAGAAWAKVALTVLEKGSLYDAPPASDSVTIFVGHDTDLNSFATALGVTWDPPEYRTHPEFLTSPPGSGIHIVRDTETGEIQVSFVYPVYHQEGHELWRTDYSGAMKETPVIWKDGLTAQWNNHDIPSLGDLESHFLSRLSLFPGAVNCFQATADELNRTIPIPVTPTITQAAKPSLSSSPAVSKRNVVAVVVPIATAAFLALSFICCQFLRRCSRKECSSDVAGAIVLPVDTAVPPIKHLNSSCHTDSSLSDDDNGGELA